MWICPNAVVKENGMMKKAVTKKMFYVFTILLVMSLFTSGPVFAFTVNANFENLALGGGASGTSGFNGVKYEVDATTVNTIVHGGNQSAKMRHLQGTETLTGVLNLPSAYGEGHEIWYRAYFYFPAGWSWANTSGKYSVIKMMRISTTSNHLSVFSDTNGSILLSNEVDAAQPTTSAFWDIGRWQCIEMYVKLSSTAPIFRIWKDGVLVIEDTTHKTLPSGGSTTIEQYIYGNWNNGPVQTQYSYVDDIVLTDVTPSQLDSNGNHMIGPTSVSATLVPPTGLQVTAK